MLHLEEVADLVVDIGDATGHAGCEIAAGRSENDHRSAGHVLAAMVTHGFDDGLDAGIADAKSLTGHAADEDFTLGRAIQRNVADDHVLFRCKGAGCRRIQDEFAAAQALPK